MKRPILGISLALVMSPGLAPAFEALELRVRCKEPASDECVYALFEAARVEITFMGHEKDFRDGSELAAEIGAYLDRDKQNVLELEDPNERQQLLQIHDTLREMPEPEIANAMMMAAGFSAYSAIGDKNFSGYGTIANAMVPDIMDLWERQLDILSEKQSVIPCKEPEFECPMLSFPPIIADYQENLGFLSDARETQERYLRRAPDLIALLSADQGPIRELLANVSANLRAYELIDASRHAKTTKEFLSLDPEIASQVLSRIIHVAPESVSPELLSGFLRVHGDQLGESDLSGIAEALIAARRFNEARPLIISLRDSDWEYASLLSDLIKAAPESLSSDFVIKSGEGLEGWRGRVVTEALIATGRIEDARYLIRAFDDGEAASESLAKLVRSFPERVSAEDVGMLLGADRAVLSGADLVGLTGALAAAGRLDDARAVVLSINNADEAVMALAAMYRGAPNEATVSEREELLLRHWPTLTISGLTEFLMMGNSLPTTISSRELVEFIQNRRASGQDWQLGGLLAELIQTGRRGEALAVFYELVQSNSASLALVSKVLAAAPEALQPAELALLLTARRDETSESELEALVETLAAVQRIDEARAVAQTIQNPLSAGDAYAALAAAAPDRFIEEDLPDFFAAAAHGYGLDLFQFAERLLLAGYIKDARSLVLQALHDRPRASLNYGQYRTEVAMVVACESGFIPEGENLIAAFLPEILSHLEAQSSPCHSALALARLGSVLLASR